jgi:hypothetical protein
MAVDSLGRYAVSDMEDRVRRLLDALALVVSTVDGSETSATQQEQMYSNVDILNQINASLTAIYLEIILGKEFLFAQTVYLSTKANFVGPYGFPPNMLQVRYMKWKPFSLNLTTVRPEDWRPMVMSDDPADMDMMQQYEAPTWRWDGGGFRLNKNLTQDNTNGIELNMVALPSELVSQADVINAPFARVAQQAIIYDAAYNIAWSKLKQVTDEIKEGRTEWHQRLLTTVENAFNPVSKQFTSNRLIQNTFTGRRGWRGNW